MFGTSACHRARRIAAHTMAAMLATVSLLVLSPSPDARAKELCGTATTVADTAIRELLGCDDKKGGTGGGGNQANHKCDKACQKAVEQRRKEAAARKAWDAYDKAMRNYQAKIDFCQKHFEDDDYGYALCRQLVVPVEPQKPSVPNYLNDPDVKSTGAKPVDPKVVAEQAVAELKLPKATPHVGPPPSINEWKIAAVGYPLWLWTDAGDRVLTDSVTLRGVTVTLTAKRTSTTFDMGEVNPHTQGKLPPKECTATTRWTLAVEPGAPSPTCGYRYQWPSATKSFPNTVYPIRATDHWTVTWTATGALTGKGTIAMNITGTGTLRVGELQIVNTYEPPR